MAKKVRGVRHIEGDTYFIDFQVGLERHQERVKAVSMSVARAIRDERKVELRRQALMPHRHDRMKASFADAWIKLEADLLTDCLSIKSLQRYKRIYHVLFTEFRLEKFPEIKSPSELTLPFLLEYKNHFVQEQERSPSGGWRAELIYIKSLIRRLNKLGFCGKAVVEQLTEIRRPAFEKKAYPDIPNEQLKKMFDFIKEDRPAYYFMLKFALITGRRIGEITSIEKSDIDWDGLVPVRINIRAKTTKMKRDAPITRLNEELRQTIIQACRRNPSSKYVFSGSKSKQCNTDRVRQYLNRVSKNILGARLTPHYFRHRFMTECGKARVPFADVSNISGLKDAEVMQRHYQHSTQDGLDSVLAVTTL